MSTMRQLAQGALHIDLLYAKAGIHEVGGSNLGYDVEWYQRAANGVAGESWCDDLIYACWLKYFCFVLGLLTGKTAHENRQIMLRNADRMSRELNFPRTGSCNQTIIAAKRTGRFRDPDFHAVPSDLVAFDFPVNGKRLGRAHHIGIVVGWQGNNLLTVEGNTSPGLKGSQTNGQGIYPKRRSLDSVVGFVYFGT